MTDAVTIDYVFKGTRRAKVKLTNISDSTGESGVVKIDLSTLIAPGGAAPSKVSIETIEASVQGFTSVKLYFDHTTDDILAVLGTGYSYFDYTDTGGFTEPASSGGTGDVILTTTGASATATYDLSITFRLKD